MPNSKKHSLPDAMDNKFELIFNDKDDAGELKNLPIDDNMNGIIEEEEMEDEIAAWEAAWDSEEERYTDCEGGEARRLRADGLAAREGAALFDAFAAPSRSGDGSRVGWSDPGARGTHLAPDD